MNIKNSLFIFSLFIVLICSVTVISAVSTDSMDNIASDMISNDEFISVSSGELASCVDESKSVLQAKDGNLINNDVLKDEDDDCDDDCDDAEDYDEEDDDWDDGEEDDNVLDEDDINEYMEDIKSSTSDEYFKFFTYLTKTKGFKFDIDSADSDEGYVVYASQRFDIKLYGGNKYTINIGDTYFVSTNCRSAYVFDTYYPDVIYQQNNNLLLDEYYLGWLKWNEQYKLSLDLAIGSDNLNHTSYSSVSYADSNLPFYFDLRNDNGSNYVTPIKNQKLDDNCWAFAAIAGLESYLLKTEGKTHEFSSKYDFSENNLKNVMSSLSMRGTDLSVNSGGRISMPIAYFLRWSGPILESQDEYNTNNIIEYYKASKHVQGIKYIHKRKGPKDNNEIKKAIMDYGGVVTSIYWHSDFENGANYYVNIETDNIHANHAVLIIGWNDTYSRDNFKTTPSGDGAWVVKNSWGEEKGDEGYYYVSYYDTQFALFGLVELDDAVGFSFTSVENDTNYGRNYHYTPLGTTYWANFESKGILYRNTWTVYCDETLKACGVYTNNATNCYIDVLVNDEIVSTKNCLLDYAGFHTITLDTPVKISCGQSFTIEVTLISNNNISLPIEAPFGSYSKASSNHESELYTTSGWIDISEIFDNSNICLNAYTEYTPLETTTIDASDLTMNYGDSKVINVKLKDSKGNPLINAKLVFTIDGVSQVITTNNNGEAKLIPTKNLGRYDVKIEYFGSELYDYTIKKITLTVSKQQVNIIFSNRPVKSDLTITLKSGSIPLKSEKINIQIGKKKYNNKKLDKNGKYTVSRKLTKSPAIVKVTYKGNDKYKEKTKTGYIYKEVKAWADKSTYKVSEEITLKLDNVKKLNVKVTLNGVTKKIKFNNGKYTFKPKVFNLKKGKKYAIKFKSTNKKYKITNTKEITIK